MLRIFSFQILLSVLCLTSAYANPTGCEDFLFIDGLYELAHANRDTHCIKMGPQSRESHTTAEGLTGVRITAPVTIYVTANGVELPKILSGKLFYASIPGRLHVARVFSNDLSFALSYEETTTQSNSGSNGSGFYGDQGPKQSVAGDNSSGAGQGGSGDGTSSQNNGSPNNGSQSDQGQNGAANQSGSGLGSSGSDDALNAFFDTRYKFDEFNEELGLDCVHDFELVDGIAIQTGTKTCFEKEPQGEGAGDNSPVEEPQSQANGNDEAKPETADSESSSTPPKEDWWDKNTVKNALNDAYQDYKNLRKKGSATDKYDKETKEFNDNLKEKIEEIKSSPGYQENGEVFAQGIADLAGDGKSDVSIDQMFNYDRYQKEDFDAIDERAANEDVTLPYNSKTELSAASKADLIREVNKLPPGSEKTAKLLQAMDQGVVAPFVASGLIDKNGLPANLKLQTTQFPFSDAPGFNELMNDPQVIRALRHSMHWSNEAVRSIGKSINDKDNYDALQTATGFAAAAFNPNLSKQERLNLFEAGRRLSAFVAGDATPGQLMQITDGQLDMTDGLEISEWVEDAERVAELGDYLYESLSKGYGAKGNYDNVAPEYQEEARLLDSADQSLEIIGFHGEIPVTRVRQEILDDLAKPETERKFKISEEELIAAGRLTTDIALGFVPGVGWLKDGVELITGYNYITQEKLSVTDRAWAAFGVVTVGYGSKIKNINKIIKKTPELKQALKAIKNDMTHYFSDVGDTKGVLKYLEESGDIYLKEFEKAKEVASGGILKRINRLNKTTNKIPDNREMARGMDHKYAEAYYNYAKKVTNGEKVSAAEVAKLGGGDFAYVTKFSDIEDVIDDSHAFGARLSLFNKSADTGAISFTDTSGYSVVKFTLNKDYVDALKSTDAKVFRRLREVYGTGFLSGGTTLGGASEWLMKSDILQKHPDIIEKGSLELIRVGQKK